MTKINKKINDSINFAVTILEENKDSIGYNITQRIKGTKHKYLVKIEIIKENI